MRRSLKEMGCRILHHTGVLRLFKKTQPIILTYHRINPKLFSDHVQYLKKHHTVLSLSSLLDVLDQGTLPQNAVVLTIDDGYKDTFTHAFPALKRTGLSATLFVAPSMIDANTFAWWDRLEHRGVKADYDRLKKLPPEELERQVQDLTGLTESSGKPTHYDFCAWDEIKEMQGVIDIGAHTMTHPILPTIPLDRATKEIADSRHALTSKLGIEPFAFAYPNGNATAELSAVVAKAGFRCALTMQKGRIFPKTDRFLLPRRGINERDGVAVLAAKVRGAL